MLPSNSQASAAAARPARRGPRRASTLTLGTVALLLAACAAGPDFSAPAAPKATAYTNEPLTDLAASGTALLKGQTPPVQWWTLFSAPRLNETVRLALRGNRDLAAAQENLAQAAEIAHASTAGLYPELDYNAGVGR